MCVCVCCRERDCGACCSDPVGFRRIWSSHATAAALASLSAAQPRASPCVIGDRFTSRRKKKTKKQEKQKTEEHLLQHQRALSLLTHTHNHTQKTKTTNHQQRRGIYFTIKYSEHQTFEVCRVKVNSTAQRCSGVYKSPASQLFCLPFESETMPTPSFSNRIKARWRNEHCE